MKYHSAKSEEITVNEPRLFISRNAIRNIEDVFSDWR